MKNQNLFRNQSSTIGNSSFRDLFKQTSCRLLLALCISLLTLKVSAQEVRELNSVLSGNNNEANRLRSLVNDIQPTLSFQQSDVIGDKAGAPILIDADEQSITNPIDIALKELEAGILPITIRRTLPDGTFQDIPLKWLMA